MSPMADYSRAYEKPHYLSDVEKKALAHAFELAQHHLAVCQEAHDYAVENLRKAEQALQDAEDAHGKLVKWAHG